MDNLITVTEINNSINQKVQLKYRVKITKYVYPDGVPFIIFISQAAIAYVPDNISKIADWSIY